MNTDEIIIQQTQCWLDRVIIGRNICPFAKRERDLNRIRFFVEPCNTFEDALESLIRECEYLENNTDTETTLFILQRLTEGFNDYLDFLAIAMQLLNAQGYEGVFQLASFHPDYCFADSEPEDPANYTNRSPYPMLHIIREESLERALQNYPQPELIPQRNIELCRSLGLKTMQKMLQECREPKE